MNFRKIFQAAVLLPSLCLGGCLSTIFGSKEERSDDYSLPTPGAGWEKIDPADADSAFRNKKDKAILSVSSICGQDRFRSLEDLSADVLRQLPGATTVGVPVARQMDGNPGMITEAEGQVDGNPMKVRLAVIRTAKCLYDIILAGDTLDASSQAAFDNAVGGFSERSKR
ncbi:MAG: hypothetical protein V4655_06555 [Bdellovibrionota bacterium]